MSTKLAVKLGLRDKIEKDFTNMVSDMTEKFSKKQGMFIRNTFTAFEGFADDPTKRTFQKVSSTVKEQLDWFKNHAKDYFETVLTIEKTNAQGPKAELVVDGESWGMYTTLELLRLKGILDSKLKAMVQVLPIRPESVVWKKTTDSIYEGRDVWETGIDEGHTKTTLKRTEIVADPHIKDAPNRAPIAVPIETQVNTGKYTTQDFSGAITNKERAELEVRYNNIYKGVIAALEEANATVVAESDLGDKVLGYLFK